MNVEDRWVEPVYESEDEEAVQVTLKMLPFLEACTTESLEEIMLSRTNDEPFRALKVWAEVVLSARRDPTFAFFLTEDRLRSMVFAHDYSRSLKEPETREARPGWKIETTGVDGLRVRVQRVRADGDPGTSYEIGSASEIWLDDSGRAPLVMTREDSASEAEGE